MELLNYYKAKPADKLKLKIKTEKTRARPAWIYVEGLPKGTNFLMVNLGKFGKEGRRIQFYKTYLPEGLFIPIDYTNDEMKRFYDKFCDIYDIGFTKNKQNLRAGKFLADKVKKYAKGNKVLDLGAGTGLITSVFVKEGFKDITLVDFSKGMLECAKKRKGLQKCKFKIADVRDLNLNQTFDIVISNFSFGAPSYFTEKELVKAIMLVKKHMKKTSIFAIIGMFNRKIFEQNFNTIDSGTYPLLPDKGIYCDYFIGTK